MKQNAAMLLFVKHVADKNNISLFFSDATVDIAMPSPYTASSHAISAKAFSNSLGPREPKRISRAE